MAVVLRSDGVPAVVVDADVASAPSGAAAAAAGGATGGLPQRHHALRRL